MEEISITQMQEAMESGGETAVSLVEKYLARIEALDRSGPAINSVLELNPDALAIAAALDKERQESGPRGALHGIPLLIKGNIDTADRMATTAGSLALAGSVAAADAHHVTLLRKAGAIILGKSNLSEWANFRSTRSSSGWSSQGGQVKNPYILDRNPCGSSSGSGAAVAANLCAAAVGTETDGSIVCPANANGIVGIKPTVGLVSRSGIIPISHSQDTAGPMARTVADAALLLNGLIGVDNDDPATMVENRVAFADYTRFLKGDGLKGARIGVVRNIAFEPAVMEVLGTAVKIMADLGAEIVDPVEIPNVAALEPFEWQVTLYEFKDGLNRYLANLPDNLPQTLAELIAFNEANQEKVMPYFGQELFYQAQEKGPLSDEAYQRALAACRRLSREEGLDAALGKNDLDALVVPTRSLPWLTDWINGDHFGKGSSTAAAVSGYPSISVPAGYSQNLPVNISFIAGPWQEGRLIQLAYAFEQAANVRRPPQFLPTAVFE